MLWYMLIAAFPRGECFICIGAVHYRRNRHQQEAGSQNSKPASLGQEDLEPWTNNAAG